MVTILMIVATCYIQSQREHADCSYKVHEGNGTVYYVRDITPVRPEEANCY